MRILFLALDIDLTLNRGDSIHVLKVFEALANASHDVHLVVGKAPERLTKSEGRISVCTSRKNLPTLGFVIRAATATKPDAIYERRFSPKVSSLVGSLLGIPHVVEYNGIPEDELAMLDRGLEKDPFWTVRTTLRHALLRQATALVAVTPGIKREMVRRYHIRPERIFVVQNGVDPVRFHPRPKNDARERLGLPRGPIVCFVGNLVRWQGLDCLMEAMSLSPPEIGGVIVGDGPDRDRLLEASKRLSLNNRIRFVGEVPHDDVPAYIAAADVCVAPFTAMRNAIIGVSALKVLEYIACARPVIVSDIAGSREIVDQYQCGKIVPPDDSRALATAIIEAVTDPQLAWAASQASESVRIDRSWDQTALQITKVLESFIR